MHDSSDSPKAHAFFHTTLVVFNCGNLERIGVRDRHTQSLYLTDVIDIHACKEPAYGRLHVALYMIALEDALDRVKQQFLFDAEAQRAKVPVDVKGQSPRRKRAKTGYSRRRGRDKKNETQKLTEEENNGNQDEIQARLQYTSWWQNDSHLPPDLQERQLGIDVAVSLL